MTAAEAMTDKAIVAMAIQSEADQADHSNFNAMMYAYTGFEKYLRKTENQQSMIRKMSNLSKIL